MAILEELLEEVKRLNKNLKALNTELDTVDSSEKKEEVKEKPIEKAPAKAKTQEEPTSEYTKDYVLSLGKEFLKKADNSDKSAFKDKLSELNASKLSTVEAEHYPDVVEFMKARLEA
ncbi:hypothetical protein [Staphylococcus americanisciuri]|uniref:Phage protein n=1 Tax=Staphylococcus americanisciuri TaxID=2973940 RepID=A0ABT2F1Q2_9STAP|nr:hypothetical protein [Staphylococcus americanisciuri]MCS4486352.1 hypothetical protein [Staphylococcus americanisciuri]